MQNSLMDIVGNRKAGFDFILHERFEAGLVLHGWEVKALRQKRVKLQDSHVLTRNGESWLLGALVNPLASASTHVEADPQRTRKLLLHKKQINKIAAAVERRGQTCVATRLYWRQGRVKCEIALATGKKQHDKRAAIKEREWNREQGRLLKQGSR